MPKPGHHEYFTACDFMAAADALIVHHYGGRTEGGGYGEAPRSLINLTFLALEVVLKSHAKSLGLNYARKHEIAELYQPLASDPNGASLIKQVGDEYDRILQAIGPSIPACNRAYDTMDKVVSLLTNREFLRWRYIFEPMEAELLPGKTSLLEFPLFNVYLLTWLFVSRGAKTFGHHGFPAQLSYERMPLFVRVEADPTSSSSAKWTHEVRRVVLVSRA